MQVMPMVLMMPVNTTIWTCKTLPGIHDIQMQATHFISLLYNTRAQGGVHGSYESSFACSRAISAFASSSSTALAVSSVSALCSLWVRSSVSSSKPAATPVKAAVSRTPAQIHNPHLLRV